MSPLKKENRLMQFSEAIATLFENRLENRQHAWFWHVIAGAT
jgi:hypothetical protein